MRGLDMIDTDAIIDTVNGVWTNNGQTIVITGMAIALVLALVATWRAVAVIKRRTSGTPADDVISNIVTVMILALSAEGMYVVLTAKIDRPIPGYLAWAVCAVVEGLLVVLFREAKKFNETHGRPGPYGTAFWIVAAAGGFIVALSTTSAVEVFLRLALPLSIAMLHWIKLTAGNSKASKITWLITPTRLLARLGWLTGEEETLTEAQIKRQTRRIVRAAYLYSGETPGSRRQRRKAGRLRKLMLSASPEIAEEVERQILLTYSMECRVAAAMVNGLNQVQEARVTGMDRQPVVAVQPPTTISTIATPRVASPAIQQSLPAARSTAERDARDRQLLDRYRDVFAKLHADGLLNRSQIERACSRNGDKVLARQANRLLAMMLEEIER
jgi:hypothetical protein